MDQSHKSQNVPVLYPTIHHIRLEMGQVHCGFYEIGVLDKPKLVAAGKQDAW